MPLVACCLPLCTRRAGVRPRPRMEWTRRRVHRAERTEAGERQPDRAAADGVHDAESLRQEGHRCHPVEYRAVQDYLCSAVYCSVFVRFFVSLYCVAGFPFCRLLLSLLLRVVLHVCMCAV